MAISRNNYEAFFLDYIEGNFRADLHEELQLFLQNNPDLASELDEMKSFSEVHDFNHADHEVVFTGKEFLKKGESSMQEDLLDELLAKELEGDLTKEETAMLQKIAFDSSFVERWRKLFALTKLKAGNETFTDKDVVRIPESVDHSSIHELLIAHCEGDLTAEENLMLESLLASDQALRTELSLYSLTRIKPETISFPAKALLYKKETPVISLRKIYYGVAAAASVALLIVVLNYTDKSSALTVASHTPRVEMKNPIAPFVNGAQPAQGNKRPESIPLNTATNIPVDDIAIATAPKRKNILANKTNEQQPSIAQEETSVLVPAEYLQYIDAENLATLTPKGIEYQMPDMKKVYEPPIHLAPYDNQEESITLLAYLSKEASSRIAGSRAFADTEKQFELLAGKVNDKFRFERIPLEEKDELILKIGKLELRRKVSQREKITSKSLWDKAKEAVKKTQD